MEQIIKELSELKTEIKYVNKTLGKVEKVLENQAVLLEKQSVANKRILDLEREDERLNDRVRKLEDWQIRVIAIASVIATWVWFILNKIF